MDPICNLRAKKSKKERKMSPKREPLGPFVRLWGTLGLQFEAPGSTKRSHKPPKGGFVDFVKTAIFLSVFEVFRGLGIPVEL